MSDSDLPSFDLIDEPWILAQRVDGTVAQLSLLDVFGQANDLTGVVGEVATQTFALTRLLLAVLHRAVDGPRDDDHWEELWTAPELPLARIGAYLDHYRTRFDLLHPAAPFFQVAGLHTAKGEMSSLAKLIADVPNGDPFFTTRLGSGTSSISLAEAARWVVHCQAFDPSGIKSGAVGDPRVKGGKGYPIGTGWSGYLGGVLAEGRTLRETLLLNLISADYGSYAQWRTTDSPVWERDPHGPGEEQPGGQAPRGPLDLFTWQSRRIRVQHSEGRVDAVLICNGDKLTPQNCHKLEPHTAWRRSPAQEKNRGEALVYMPREHDAERSIWRGLQSLLPGAAGSSQHADGAAALAPLVLEWIGHLRIEQLLAPGYSIRLRTIGAIYGVQSSVTDEIIDDAMSISVALLRQDDPALAQIATETAKTAEGGARALWSLAGNLVDAAGGDPEGAKSRAAELGYAELDGPFRHWVASLTGDRDPTDVQIEWHQRAEKIIRTIGTGLLADAGPAAWVGRTVRGRLVTTAHADMWFRSDLRKTFPLAYLESTSENPSEATA